MARILIADDEKDLVRLLKDTLEAQGHQILVAYDGPTALEKAYSQPDLIILDIMMPGLDGYAVCRQIRDIVPCPIIFLSARQSEMDKVKGLALGGDDYITKPFGLKELSARIAAHLRREQRAILQSESREKRHLAFPGLIIDLQSRECKVHGKPIALTKREFDILELLALHPGQVFSRDQIYEKIWGYDAEGDSATVAEHIKNIRSKFSKYAAGTEYISTVWGIGYRFNKDI